MHIPLTNTLDVEMVERQFVELWEQTAEGRKSGDESAVLRARVANLLVFLADHNQVNNVDQMMRELTAIHPSRVVTMLGDRGAEDLDIHMAVASFCQTDARTGAKRLCCEQVTLKAQGNFVSELPSAALPLLISDLPTFLWWRGELQASDKVFVALLRRADRLIIDSAEFREPALELLETNKLFNLGSSRRVGISDLNWARLTMWRELLAGFYDVRAHQPLLDQIDYVRIDYVAPARQPSAIAPQSLLMAGWLASRLGWSTPSGQTVDEKNETVSFKFLSKAEGAGGREIKIELHRVEQGEQKAGRLVQVELRANTDTPASYAVVRSADNLSLVTETRLGQDIQHGRVLPVRNRSAAQLLSREMEILCNDVIYQEAVRVAAAVIGG